MGSQGLELRTTALPDQQCFPYRKYGTMALDIGLRGYVKVCRMRHCALFGSLPGHFSHNGKGKRNGRRVKKRRKKKQN